MAMMLIMITAMLLMLILMTIVMTVARILMTIMIVIMTMMMVMMILMVVGDAYCFKSSVLNCLQGAPAHEHGHRPGQAEAGLERLRH